MSNAISTTVAAETVYRMNDRERFELAMKMSETFSAASLLPEHLTHTRVDGKVEALPPEAVRGNVFMICNQALLWEIDPFAAISESYVNRGKLGFQGKLIAAVVNRELKEKLYPEYHGEGNDRTVVLTGTIKGEGAPRSVEVRLKDVRTDNQMWKKDPDQKLFYTAATKWARRHMPEVLLGITADDDLEEVPTPIVVPPTRGQALPKPQGQSMSDPMIEKYVTRISEASTRDQLDALVKSMKLDVTNEQTVEKLANLARDKWNAISKQVIIERYQGLISKCENRDQLAEIADKLRDDGLSPELDRTISDLINKAAIDLDLRQGQGQHEKQ